MLAPSRSAPAPVDIPKLSETRRDLPPTSSAAAAAAAGAATAARSPPLLSAGASSAACRSSRRATASLPISSCSYCSSA